MIMIVSGEEDGIHLTSLFSAYSFVPLEFCTVYMYCLLLKKRVVSQLYSNKIKENKTT